MHKDFKFRIILICFFFYGISTIAWWKVVVDNYFVGRHAEALFGAIFAVVLHLIFVTILLHKYGREAWYGVLLAPFVSMIIVLEDLMVLKALSDRNVRQNTPSPATVILGYADWSCLEAWIKPNNAPADIKALIPLLKARGRDFSFYAHASKDDVFSLMGDKSVMEVYFVSHGHTSGFMLNNETMIDYEDFSDGKYRKEYAHQIHCGSGEGRSLIEIVVPEANRGECICFKSLTTSNAIVRELRKRTKQAVEKANQSMTP